MAALKSTIKTKVITAAGNSTTRTIASNIPIDLTDSGTIGTLAKLLNNWQKLTTDTIRDDVSNLIVQQDNEYLANITVEAGGDAWTTDDTLYIKYNFNNGTETISYKNAATPPDSDTVLAFASAASDYVINAIGVKGAYIRTSSDTTITIA